MHCRLACRLQAGNAEGNGEFSSEAACSTAKPPPPAPTSVIAYVAAEHAGGVLCFEVPLSCRRVLGRLLPGHTLVHPNPSQYRLTLQSAHAAGHCSVGHALQA